MKLSYEAKYKVYTDYHAWVSGQIISGAIHIRNDILTRGEYVTIQSPWQLSFLVDYQIFRTTDDKKEFARPDEYRMSVPLQFYTPAVS